MRSKRVLKGLLRTALGLPFAALLQLVSPPDASALNDEPATSGERMMQTGARELEAESRSAGQMKEGSLAAESESDSMNRAEGVEASDLFAALGGPVVRETLTSTIVQRDAKGAFKRLGNIPEEAAVAALELDPEVRAYCRGVFAERKIALGVLLADHIDEAIAYGDAIDSGEREVVSELITVLRTEWESGAYGEGSQRNGGSVWWPQMVGPTQPEAQTTRTGWRSGTRTALMSDLSAVLSAGQCLELERMVSEYWEAWVKWELRSKKSPSEGECLRTRDRLERQLFADDLRRASDDLFKPFREKLDKLFLAVEPTNEQRDRIKAAVRTHMVESRLRPRINQRVRLMESLYTALDEDRRARLFGLIAAETAGGSW